MARLNFHHLHHFWAVAQEEHLTRAASRLHVSQSALSTQIRQLEDQLRVRLFEREGRRLRLTEAGQLAFAYAETIFTAGQELVSLMQDGGTQSRQRLRIGSAATLSRNFQENFLRPVLGQSDVQLVIESGSLDELLGRLAVHKLDVVLSNRAVGAEAGRQWRCRRIARQPVCLVGPPLGRGRRFRFPQDLATCALLLPGTNSEIRTRFDALCEELDVRPRVLAEVDDMAMLRLLARDSAAVALLPAVVVQDELRTRRLARYCDVPDLSEDFYAITTERRFQPAVLKDLLKRPADEVLAP
ncbi:MAG: LysR family transcriptional regulator [Gammaproteobacteria bacterium]|jgi:LysR family transcriptional regulator, transcriptional activator of nhaA|nr:LysR family transcriptional regulator [Gammaproteobacteria bacterium]